MLELRIFPSSPRRGGCAIKKKSRSVLTSRRRGGVQPQQNSAEFDHHPVRSTKEASRYFIDVAATPPRRGGENCALSIWATDPRSRGYALTALRAYCRLTHTASGGPVSPGIPRPLLRSPHGPGPPYVPMGKSAQHAGPLPRANSQEMSRNCGRPDGPHDKCIHQWSAGPRYPQHRISMECVQGSLDADISVAARRGTAHHRRTAPAFL